MNFLTQLYMHFFFIHLVSKVRHRGDILEFEIHPVEYLSITEAYLHLYVRGEDWIDEVYEKLQQQQQSKRDRNLQQQQDEFHRKLTTTTTPTKSTTITPTTTSTTSTEKNTNSQTDGGTAAINMDDATTSPLIASIPRKVGTSISISLNRLLRQRYTKADSDYVGQLPKGAGQVIRFNITNLVIDWIRAGNGSLQEIVIKTEEPWMRQLLVLGTISQKVK